jgi:hypothetical protein
MLSPDYLFARVKDHSVDDLTSAYKNDEGFRRHVDEALKALPMVARQPIPPPNEPGDTMMFGIDLQMPNGDDLFIDFTAEDWREIASLPREG